MRNILFPVLLILLIQLPENLNSQITASITADADEVCLGDSMEAILEITGGVAPWDVEINDKDGLFLNLENIPANSSILLRPISDNTYYIASVKDDSGTTGDPSGEVAVTLRQPTPVSIVSDRTTYLTNEPGIALISDPPGGIFSGTGVTGNFFYPGIATTTGSPHPVSCTFTNEFGCISKAMTELNVISNVGNVVMVAGNDTINAICDDETTYYLRGSNLSNLPGTFELMTADSAIPVPGHIADANPSDNEAILDQTGLSGGYDILYTFGTGEAMVHMTFRIHVNDLGSIGTVNLPDTVCQNSDPYLLLPELYGFDPDAVFFYSGPGISGNQANGFYYDPESKEVQPGINEIHLAYTSSNGCSTNTLTGIYNSYLPEVDFKLSGVCLPVEGGVVSFMNQTVGKDSVEAWRWNFGNPESGSNNTSEQENPVHFYSSPGFRQIILTATTRHGCVTSHSLETILADQPGADFTWLNDCYVRSERTAVLRKLQPSFTDLDTLIWTFKNNQGESLGIIGSGDASDTIEFPFPSMDKYLVELHVENEAGCSGDMTREIDLKPSQSLTSSGYHQDFNGNAGDWFAASSGSQLSWVLGEPDFTGFEQDSGDWAWYTMLPENEEGYLEESWIQSPCFDLRGISQPLVQLDIMKSFVPGTDGAILQYQDFVSEGWKTVGKVGKGLNWYNQNGIYNEPGGSSFGWGLALFEPDESWVNAVYALDFLLKKPHVKFRISIATGGAAEVQPGRFNQGFAFDNFKIGERQRFSVLEYFTNNSSESAKEADQVVDLFATNYSENVIDLQYHVDYPGVDSMNLNNTFPPSTRAFHYGIPDIPQAVLNGGVTQKTRYDFSSQSEEPDVEDLNMESLEIPRFRLALQVDYLEDKLELTAKVSCTADTFASNIQLYVVVIEREVSAYRGLNQDSVFRNVVLDMLPTPAGKLLGNGWNYGKSETVSYSWEYAPYVEDIEDLSVVAFIQDRENGKVLQAINIPHTPGVGIANRMEKPGQLSVYPNPAVDHLYVQIGNRSEIEAELQVRDLSGRIVLRKEVLMGKTLYQLDVSELSGGMYMISWMQSGKMITCQKVVLVR